MNIDSITRTVLKNCEDFLFDGDDKTIVKAFFASENVIQTAPGHDINDHIWLTRKSSGQRYFIKKASPIAMIGGKSAGQKLQYLTENEYENQPLPAINIGTINGGAVIGNYGTATFNNGYAIEEIRAIISSKSQKDQTELNELIQVVETMLKNNIPMSKGTLSKFSDILEKHSDIAIALMTSVFSWLSGN